MSRQGLILSDESYNCANGTILSSHLHIEFAHSQPVWASCACFNGIQACKKICFCYYKGFWSCGDKWYDVQLGQGGYSRCPSFS
eukprot:jgi/Botrbrau1/7293/Bobra.0318s0025.1